MNLENAPKNVLGDQIVNYLTGLRKDGEFMEEVSPESLPLRFTLPLTDTLMAIDNLPIQGFLYPEDIRKQAEASALILANRGVNTEKILEILKDTHQVAKSERAVGLYLDTSTMEIKYTKVKIGDHSNVEDPRIGFEARNNIMFLEIHTHLLPSLPSPVDYGPLLIDRGSARFCRGIVVLCPGVQVMAVATNQTPKYSDPIEFVAKVKELSQNELLQEISEQFIAILKGLSPEIENLSRVFRERAKSKTRTSSGGTSDVDEGKSLIMRKMNNIKSENDRVIGSVVKRISLEAISKLGLVIYTSNDYTNFVRQSEEELRENFE